MFKKNLSIFTFFFMLTSSAIFADKLPAAAAGMDTLTLKHLVSTPADELEPEMAVIVGSIYNSGMSEIGVEKNYEKAKIYLKTAGDKGVPMGHLLLSGACAEHDDMECFTSNLDNVMRAKNNEISIPAGFKLAGYYTTQNNIGKAVESLRFMADEYNEPRAQFMVGWSIYSKEYMPSDMTYRDGEFYLFQACTNSIAPAEVKNQCKQFKWSPKKQ